MVRSVTLLLALVPVVFIGYGCARAQPAAVFPTAQSVTTPQAEPSTTASMGSREQLLDQYFEAIKDLDFPYGNLGSVLEAIVFLQLNEEFPEPTYEVLSGIMYEDPEGATGGELDVVVWNRERNAAERVYEVKLTGNPRSKGQEARKQLKRFRQHVEENTISRFLTTRGPLDMHAEQFKDVAEYGVIGNKGTVEFGFTREFDITRPEGDVLQERLLNYKRWQKIQEDRKRARKSAPLAN